MSELTPELLYSTANTVMPFGKFKGRHLVDLPEEYLLWFERQGFPNGALGRRLALMLMLKTEGQEALLRPMIRR